MFFYMPTKVFDGDNCIAENAGAFSKLGKKALVVTGKNSARICGALSDVVDALNAVKVEYVIFDRIMSNPTVEVVYEGAELAAKENVDFVIGIGGGSPMDAAKAIALLFENSDLAPEDFLNKKYEDKALPLALVPTTCGTGSEVTPYAVITNDFRRTKSSVSCDSTFAKYAFVCNKYLRFMSKDTLINTAFDAFSHNAEGYVSVRSNYVSDMLALDGIRLFAECIPALRDGDISDEVYDKLMKASVLGGMVISHAGTCAVHSLGYSYTYFKNVDHGRANAILFPEFLRLVERVMPDRSEKILKAIGYESVDCLKKGFGELLGSVTMLTDEEVDLFTEIGLAAPSIKNSSACPDKAEIERIYKASMEY